METTAPATEMAAPVAAPATATTPHPLRLATSPAPTTNRTTAFMVKALDKAALSIGSGVIDPT